MTMGQFEPAKFNVGDIVVSKHHPFTELIVEQIRTPKEGSFYVYLTSLALDGDYVDIYFEDELVAKVQSIDPRFTPGDVCKVVGYTGVYKIYQYLGYKNTHQDHEYLVAKRNPDHTLTFRHVFEIDIDLVLPLTKDLFIEGLKLRMDDYLDLYNGFGDKEYLRRVMRLQHFIEKVGD